ncbi:MAG: hypothetical protein E7631_10980 [Ruminococcaceae bacterium]|nr:hypothetical protein [Oscillospiraceae bacterium]
MNTRISRAASRGVIRAVSAVLAGVMLALSASAALPVIESAALLRETLMKTTLPSSIRSGMTLDEDDAAIRLYFLDMITGTGTEKDGSVSFDLQRDLTRLEAVVMAVRLMGLEDSALAGGYTHPYTDVPEWASGYVGCLYSFGLLEISDAGLFLPQAPASLVSFMSYMLYALGYRMADGDYNLMTVVSQARSAGICQTAEDEPLTRGAAVVAMYNTLRANIRASSMLLSEKLVQEGKMAYADAVFLLWSTDKEETKTYLDAVGYSSEWIIPDGYYTIRTADGSNMVMNVLADGPNRDIEGLGVCVWTDTGDISQSYRLERTEKGTYLVYAACSRGGFFRLLGLSRNGKNIGIYQPTSKYALEFTIRHEEDGTWSFVTRSADGRDLYLTSSSKWGSRLQLTEASDALNCRWVLERQGITNSAGEDLALFPADSMRITQTAFDTYSHMRQNAIDMQPTNSMAFAPFNAQIVRTDPGYGPCNGVWIQSVDKVRYADGSYDYMTVLFMHDDNISNLSVGQMLTQGEYFYQSGTTGNSSGAHIHVAVYRGEYRDDMEFASGDVYAKDAFFVLDDTVIHYDYGIEWVSVSQAD